MPSTWRNFGSYTLPSYSYPPWACEPYRVRASGEVVDVAEAEGGRYAVGHDGVGTTVSRSVTLKVADLLVDANLGLASLVAGHAERFAFLGLGGVTTLPDGKVTETIAEALALWQVSHASVPAGAGIFVGNLASRYKVLETGRSVAACTGGRNFWRIGLIPVVKGHGLRVGVAGSHKCIHMRNDQRVLRSVRHIRRLGRLGRFDRCLGGLCWSLGGRVAQATRTRLTPA